MNDREAELRILPLGQRALLIEVPALEDVLALHARLEASRPDGVIDIVPAARTVMVRVDPRALALAAARAWIQATTADAAPAQTAPTSVVDLEVVYDGADLADTAALLGVSADALVARHTAAHWTVAFTGFAPGFGYLVSRDWDDDVPRLAAPRTRVPAGAVGLAGEFTGAYPRATPGGWRLIGTTDAVLFGPDAASPALLAPGTRVRFHAARPRVALPAPAAPAARDAETTSARRDHGVSPQSRRAEVVSRSGAGGAAEARGIGITEPGLLATIQDLGRTGAASLGVAPSGALDRRSARTANRLVGNTESAAVIEITMGGFRAIALRDVWVAVAGAWGPIRLAGRALDPYEAHAWRAGEELHVDWFAHGSRAYLAVRGGIRAPATLGSRATDVLSGLGPPRLAAGDVVAIDASVDAPIPVAALAPWGAPHDDELEIELAPGPRADWFTASAREALFEAVWTVTNDTDRVGMRLDGPELPRAEPGELPSEGMLPGALQVPPSGRPTILLADGPVTGGYPVIAVATDAALDLLAQARPGTRIRFRHARPV